MKEEQPMNNFPATCAVQLIQILHILLSFVFQFVVGFGRPGYKGPLQNLYLETEYNLIKAQVIMTVPHAFEMLDASEMPPGPE
jgi:hypothetical protein